MAATRGPAHARSHGPWPTGWRSGGSSRLGRVEERLLAWFSHNGRDLPWRRTRDPYAILVSEVMCQQTQAERVAPRWRRWLARWPTVETLAAAAAGDVIREWQGLGYNRRALRVAGRRQRAPRGRAHRAGVLPRRGAGADGSRQDGLPGARPPLRDLPAGRRLPLTGPPLRASPPPDPLRGLVPPAAGPDPAPRRGRPAAARRPRRGRRSLARPGRARAGRGRGRLPASLNGRVPSGRCSPPRWSSC